MKIIRSNVDAEMYWDTDRFVCVVDTPNDQRKPDEEVFEFTDQPFVAPSPEMREQLTDIEINIIEIDGEKYAKFIRVVSTSEVSTLEARHARAIAYAREHIANDDLEIDDEPAVSDNDHGVWVQAWIHVPEDCIKV